MSAYLSNALTAAVGTNNSNTDRPSQVVPPVPPPPHYLPFLMGPIDEKLLQRLPSNQHHPHFSLLYHNNQSNINPSSVSPSSNSSSSESYLTNQIDRFDHHHRRLKLEIQDTTA
jgi:hypothetical protein